MSRYIKTYLHSNTKAAPLAVFRIVFGLMMCAGIVRFWSRGWIEELYLMPAMQFHYLGFDFIEVPGKFTYVLFVICGLSALLVAIGYRYRLAIVVFFLSFTYIELLDKTTYLNHYYFISVLSFVMIWLPMHAYFSVDARRNSRLASEYVPKWSVDAIKVLLAIVYVYAGAAKLNYDWIVRAMPLAIWLPAKLDATMFGALMHERWVHYAFSWGGALYDLSIVFLLLWKRTRLLAFGLVIVFHVLTAVLFPIGMFPYIMIGSALIFFSPRVHDTILQGIARLLRIHKTHFDNGRSLWPSPTPAARMSMRVLACVIVVQLLAPLRSVAYPGSIYWTEQGYRFSWRVMLMEKTGSATFKVVDGQTGKWFYVQNDEFLTPLQQKQMATQPDFIIEYAHYLGDYYATRGFEDVSIYVDSYVALNGRKHQQFIDPEVDLMKVNNSLYHKDFILPAHE